MRSTSIFSLALFFVFSISGVAQTSSIEGRIQDADGNLIPGAKIVLRSKTSNAERIAISDRHGQFSFSELGQGPFEIEVTANGFTAERVDAAAGSETVITLSP